MATARSSDRLVSCLKSTDMAKFVELTHRQFDALLDYPGSMDLVNLLGGASPGARRENTSKTRTSYRSRKKFTKGNSEVVNQDFFFTFSNNTSKPIKSSS